MPGPPTIGEKRFANGETRVWTGQGWARVESTPFGGIPMISLPPAQTSNRTDAQDFNAFKNLLMGVGGMAPMLLGPEIGIPARIAMAALGGASGRAVGHGMVAGARGEQPPLIEDIGTGATEGALMEGGLPVAAQGLKWVGKATKAIGEMLGMGGSISPWVRAMIGREVGGTPGMIAATAGPPILSATGRGMETAGEKIGTRTLSQRLQALKSAPELPNVYPVDPAVPGQIRTGTEVPYQAKPGTVEPLQWDKVQQNLQPALTGLKKAVAGRLSATRGAEPAISELSTPGAQEYMTSQARKNKGIYDWIHRGSPFGTDVELGDQLDALANPRSPRVTNAAGRPYRSE